MQFFLLKKMYIKCISINKNDKMLTKMLINFIIVFNLIHSNCICNNYNK